MLKAGYIDEPYNSNNESIEKISIISESIPINLVDFINSPDSIPYLELGKDLKAKGINPHDILGLHLKYTLFHEKFRGDET